MSDTSSSSSHGIKRYRVEEDDIHLLPIRKRLAKCRSLVGFDFSPLKDCLATLAATHGVEQSRLLQDFIRFMCIKAIVADEDAKYVSPTPLIDAVWHQAILHTELYARLQKRLRQKIHHRPEGALESDRAVRVERTRTLWKTLFSSEPLEVPDLPPPPFAVPLILKDSVSDKTTRVEVPLATTTIGQVKEMIHDLNGSPVADLFLSYGANRFRDDDDTLAKLGVPSGAIITYTVRPKGN